MEIENKKDKEYAMSIETMNVETMMSKIKQHPDYHKAGMILCHNGVVRATSREGDEVKSLKVSVDHKRLDEIIEEQKKREGIIEILIHINEDRELVVGDDVMFLVVAGNGVRKKF